MDDLIQALTIFRKYANLYAPTNCTHDELYVIVDPAIVSAEDKALLEKLGFYPSGDGMGFVSYRYGSA